MSAVLYFDWDELVRLIRAGAEFERAELEFNEFDRPKVQEFAVFLENRGYVVTFTKTALFAKNPLLDPSPANF